MAYIFNGKEQADQILYEIKQKISKTKVKPILTIIRTGNDPTQLKFTEIKSKTAKSLGIKCEIHEYSQNAMTEELVQLIKTAAKTTTGILIQLPLPKQVDTIKVLNSIPYEKDVEGLSKRRAKELLTKIPEIYSPVAKAIVETLKNALKITKQNIQTVNIIILGEGFLTGKPVFNVLKSLNATVRIYNPESPNIKKRLKNSDVVISGVGKPNFIIPEDIKDNTIVIDAGFEVKNGKIYGDVDPSVKNKATFFTPVPGGIGPLTVAYIFDNLLKLTE